MRSFLFLLIHFLTTLAKLLGPGGLKAVLAENLLLKQQLYSNQSFSTPGTGIIAHGSNFHGVAVVIHDASPVASHRDSDSALYASEISSSADKVQIPPPVFFFPTR